jgi:ribosomal protein S18 acetylase RimI-like enzyme
MPRRLAVSAAAPTEYPAACRALFRHVADAEREARAARTLELFASGEFHPDGLLVARHAAGGIAGAVLVQRHPGAAAVVWPPGATHAHVEDALARAAVEYLRAANVKQAQTLLPPDERPRARPLEAAGFRHVTQLAFLCRPVAASAFDPAASPLTFAPTPDAAPPFGETLLATYDGTFDCPELNGTRTAAEVIAGYRSNAGGESPDWLLVRRGAEPVGVVLFAPGPQPGILELTYLGLVRSARGRGFGQELLRHALWHAARREAEWLALSVDARNEPALRLYRRHQFREYNRQDVFLWHPTG